MKNYTVVWSKNAENQLKEIYQYIKSESVQNAEQVKSKIFQSTLPLSENPERYPVDKYKRNNDGSFRAYEIYSFRISYHIATSEIVILRIRNTKMKPRTY